MQNHNLNGILVSISALCADPPTYNGKFLANNTARISHRIDKCFLSEEVQLSKFLSTSFSG
jgi:hypothetical protein